MTHRVTLALLESEELGRLLCLDYQYTPLEQMAFSSIYVPGEPLTHMARLEQAILEEGFQEPLVVANRLLVEGHHRAAIGLKHGLPTPAQLHSCHCPPAELDFFGLCGLVNKACKRDHKRASAAGWRFTR